MSGEFHWRRTADINLNGGLFERARLDYPDFAEKFVPDANALICEDADKISAFLHLSRESAPLTAQGIFLPAVPRLKIDALYFSNDRCGESALGVALWYWRQMKCGDIYAAVSENDSRLFGLLERFGFFNAGKTERGERVYIKSRNRLSLKDPLKSFPFISSRFDFARVLPIDDIHHDILFPYAESLPDGRALSEAVASGGVIKTFVAVPNTLVLYKTGMPIFIYRTAASERTESFESAITSYCTISGLNAIKINGAAQYSSGEFIRMAAGSGYSASELSELYNKKSSVILLKLLFCGCFPRGHSVTHGALWFEGLFGARPYNIVYNRDDFAKILRMGAVDPENTMISQ